MEEMIRDYATLELSAFGEDVGRDKEEDEQWYDSRKRILKKTI